MWLPYNTGNQCYTGKGFGDEGNSHGGGSSCVFEITARFPVYNHFILKFLTITLLLQQW